jgi:hypothetical protein
MKMSDKELFARCGGVRLGRAGRHRFFDAKLARIADHNAKTTGVAAESPYERRKAQTEELKRRGAAHEEL